jgi:hypothetical protein
MRIRTGIAAVTRPFDGCKTMPESAEDLGRWIPQIRGFSPFTQSFEVSVVREGYSHGQQSLGWFGPWKILIASGETTKSAWRQLQKDFARAAREHADKLNREESSK